MTEPVKKNVRNFKWLILVSAYSVLIAFIAVFDEPLNPEIKRFVNFHSDAVPAEENGYYAALGFQAPPGTDIHARGIEIARTYTEAIQKDPDLEAFDQNKLFGKSELSFTGQVPELYKDRGFSCLEYARTSKKDIERLLGDNRELLGRYRLLYRYPHFRDVAPAGPFFPRFAPIRSTNRLMLLGLALEVNAGRSQTALADVKQDIEYWRSVLKESNDLISKLVAASAIRTDYLFLSDLVRQNRIGQGQWPVVGSLTRPLTSGEADMSGAMRREFGSTMNQIRAIKRHIIQKSSDTGKDSRCQILLWPFFKVNASINIVYPSHKKLAAAAALPAKDLAAESRKWEGAKKTKLGLATFYNFAGAVMHEPIGDLENLRYLPYLLKIHDLDGLLRLVALQCMARQQKVLPRNMDGFLQAAGPQYSDPYTGSPVKWDAERKCIFFESLSKENEKARRIELYL